MQVTAELSGAAGRVFWLMADAPGYGQHDLSTAQRIGAGALNADGFGEVTLMLPEGQAWPSAAVGLYAIYRGQSGGVAFGPERILSFGGEGAEGDFCQTLDLDYQPGDGDTQTGQVISDEWELDGIHVSATNNAAGHQDLAIIFDSANPTGDDGDLLTPGYGVGNDTALGKLLIIAEDDWDAGGDGFIDDPDDEMFGGIIRFDFDEAIKMCAVKIVDIDDEAFGGTLHFDFDYDIIFMEITILDVDGSRMDYVELQDAAHTTLLTIDALNLGDNSVQTLMPAAPVAGVRYVILHLDGSGATTRLRWCPQGGSGS